MYKMHSFLQRYRVFCIVGDIKNKNDSIKIRKIHNNAGNVPREYIESVNEGSIDLPLSKNCGRPFREFIVQHDGTVVICCHDWSSKGVIGDLSYVDISCKSIWEGDLHMLYLRYLHRKDRSLHPCNECDYSGGYRLGFLRNPMTGESYKDKKGEK